MLKRVMKIVSIFALLLLLAGCNVRQKIAEKTTEKIMEKTTGAEKVNIDNKEGKMTIEGDDGEVFAFGSSEWPDNELADNVPMFEKGAIVSVMEMPNMVSINFDGVSSDDFSEYLKVIEKEFPDQSHKMNSEGYFSYSATNEDDVNVQLTFSEGSMAINVLAGDD